MNIMEYCTTSLGYLFGHQIVFRNVYSGVKYAEEPASQYTTVNILKSSEKDPLIHKLLRFNCSRGDTGY